MMAWEGKKEIVYTFELDNGAILLFERSNGHISSYDNITLQLSIYNGFSTESLGIEILTKSVSERVNMISLENGDYLFTLLDESLHIWKSKSNTYQKLEIIPGQSVSNIYSMKKNAHGIYAAIRIGDSLFSANWNGKNFEKNNLLLKSTNPNEYRNCLHILANHNIISTRMNGTMVLDKKGQLVKKIESIDEPKEVDTEDAKFYFRYMEEYGDQILCFAGHRAPALYTLDTSTFELKKFRKQFTKKGNHIYSYRDAQNRICFQNNYSASRSTELLRMDADSIFFMKYPRLQLLRNSQSENPLEYSLASGELYKPEAKKSNIKHVLPTQSFRSVCPINGDNNFWIGSNGGSIHKLNAKTDALSPLKFNDGLKQIKFFLHKKLSAFNKNYLANTETSFIELDPDQTRIKREYIPYAHSRYGEICAWLLDKNKIYFGNADGPITCLDLQTNQRFSTSEENLFITQDLLKEKNILYAATSQGLKIFKIENNTFVEQEQKPSLFNQSIISLFATQKYIWIGTEKNGLLRWNRREEITQFAEAEGLANPSVVDIIQDTGGRLWASTLKGVYLLESEEATSLYAPFESVLSEIEFNRFASYAHSDGTIFLGALYGMYYFNARDVPSLPVLPTLYLNSLEYYQDSAIQKSYYFIQNASSISIPVEHKYLNLTFSQSDIRAANKHTYYYKLNNDDWKVISTSNRLELPFLPSGNQTLYIKAKDAFGRELTNQFEIHLNVADYFYKSWWFLALIGLAVGGIAFLWIHRLRREKVILEGRVQSRTATIEQQKEELKKIDELKNRFFSNISHELRTPLTLILSPLRKLVKTDTENMKSHDTQEIISVMHSNAELLNERIEELLDLSRISSNEIKVDKNQVHLKSFLQEVVNIFSLQAKEKGHKLEVQFDVDDKTNVILDSKRVKRIIQNLVGNAIKYCPSESTIKVLFSQQQQSLGIRVIDNGPGIAKTDQEKIFERFYQVSSAMKSDNPGTGIGLAMVKEYVELLNGSLKLNSVLNEGSSFLVALPFEFSKKSMEGHENETVSTKTENLDSLPFNTNKPKLLFAEDNSDLRKYISSILNKDYQIESFRNGKLAWESLQKNKYDIILSDIMMPEMDGLTFLDKVRSSDKFKNLPFVFLTAKSSKQSKIHSFNIGLDDYVVKPFEEEELLARLKALYTNYKKRIQSQEEIVKESEEEQELLRKTNLNLEKLYHYLVDNLSSPSLSLEYAAEELGITRRTLDRKLKIEKGMTAAQFLKEIQLNTARDLKTKGQSVQEIALAIGMRDIKYLKGLYQTRFGSELK